MNNRIFVSLLLGALPLTMMAQDDDMYFVPSKKTHEHVAPHRDAPRSHSTYYSGSNRSVDEYNRRGFGSSYQVVSNDTTGNDIIQFSAERGVYPDSTMTEDFALTRQMARYDDYDVDLAYREGYRDGTTDSWHSPWFYSSYYPWYDSSYWYWNDPWYYRHYGWYSTWYDPWYYDYGWYGPYHYGYYSYYRPYYYGGGYYSGRSRLYSHNGNTGTINRSGRSHGYFTGGSRASSGTATRATQRATYNNNGNVYRSNSGNFSRSTSSSGNFSRSTTSSSSNYNRSSSTSSSSGNFSRSSSSSSSGSFSRSSGGGSFSGGGGGSRGGGSIGRAGRR